MTTQRLYGLWDSPISADMMAGQKGLNDVQWAGDGETIVWAESRGKSGALVARRGADAGWDISGNVNVRGGVGYAGGEFTVWESTVFFAAGDGCLYRTEIASGEPRAITPAFGRVASPSVSPDGRWVAYVWTDGDTDVLAVVDAHGRQWPQKIVVGADFYMQPGWSADGGRLAWIAWDHPNMPWDGTRLESAAVEAADSRGVKLGPIQVWAGSKDVSVQQPGFSPDGRWLAYVSDETGFSHIHLRNLESGDVTRITHGDAEYGGPAWVQGLRHFQWSEESTYMIAVRKEFGRMSLERISVEGKGGAISEAAIYAAVGQPSLSMKGHIAFLGSSPHHPPRIVALMNGTTPRIETRATQERIPSTSLAPMQPLRWPVESVDGTTEVYGNYYPPTNPEFSSLGRPPAIVMIHGGPTGQRTAAYDSRNQFFASRGFAILDVNYRGSTGYGRDYQDALRGNWGVYDVEDAVAAAQYLIDADLADPDKIVIMGGSAGGYTVLQALTDYPGAFKAGVCMYGIGNLFSLDMDTHKFESQYNQQLVGPLPATADKWRARSPLFKADQISDAIAVYHGREDKVVPIDQAETIVRTLVRRGVPHVYHVYDDEGHGWRKPENIKHFYESLMAFLKENVIFG